MTQSCDYIPMIEIEMFVYACVTVKFREFGNKNDFWKKTDQLANTNNTQTSTHTHTQTYTYTRT